MKPGDTLTVGSTVLWNSNYWLVTDVDDDGLYPVGIIDKCNNVLKWLNESGGVEEVCAIVLNKSLYTVGTQENKYMVMPDSKMNVTISFNDKTKLIKRDSRFLLGFNGIYYPYILTQPDILSRPGLIDYVLVEDVLKSEDNLTNGIAWNEWNTNTTPTTDVYELKILNNSAITISRYGTWQIEWEVRKNGEIISLPVSFTSSNTGSVTVNSSGYCQGTSNVGSSTITVKLSQYPSIYFTVVVTVSTTAHNYTVEIDGNSIIYLGETKRYVAIVKDLGVTMPTANVVWSINYNGNSEQIVSLKQTSDTKVIDLMNNNIGLAGKIYLIAKYANDQTKQFTKTIDIRNKSFW
jgi:hypothetical protein